MAVILVAWARYIASIAHKPQKLAQLANRVFHIDYHDYTEEKMALLLADKLQEFFQSLNLKTTLTELNITNEHFTEMALRTTQNNTCTVGHYVPLDKDKIIAILLLAQ